MDMTFTSSSLEKSQKRRSSLKKHVKAEEISEYKKLHKERTERTEEYGFKDHETLSTSSKGSDQDRSVKSSSSRKSSKRVQEEILTIVEEVVGVYCLIISFLLRYRLWILSSLLLLIFI